MLCNPLPYNENEFVRIEKDRCYNYRIINKTGCPMTVSVNRINSGSVAFYQELDLPCLGSVSVVLPEDGIYVVKGKGPEGGCLTLTIIDSEFVLANVLEISVFDIGPTINRVINFVRDVSQGPAGTAYNGSVPGVAGTSLPANMNLALASFGVATGLSYVVSFVDPGVPLPGGLDVLYADTTGHRLVVGYVGHKIDQFSVASVIYTPVQNAVAYYYPTFTPPDTFITGMTIDSFDIVECPMFYDMTLSADIAASIALAQNYLYTLGTSWNIVGPGEIGALILGINNFVYPIINIEFSSGSLAYVNTDWCTTFFEWCKLWDCAQTKFAEWLCCNDPCAPGCPNPPTGADWLDIVGNLTLWGMFPLLTEHHLFQFGNLSDDEGANLERMKPTVLLWDRWYKMVNGCGCAPTKDCGCNETGLISQSPIVQIPTCKTC